VLEASPGSEVDPGGDVSPLHSRRPSNHHHESVFHRDPHVESDETPLCSRHFHIESQLALCPGNVLGKPLGWIT
jgi:hypothetical protein